MSLDNPMFAQLDQPGIGRYRVPGSPMSFSHDPRETPRRAPILGEHTEAILGDVIGLPDTEIAQLFDAGVVKQGKPKPFILVQISWGSLAPQGARRGQSPPKEKAWAQPAIWSEPKALP